MGSGVGVARKSERIRGIERSRHEKSGSVAKPCQRLKKPMRGKEDLGEKERKPAAGGTVLGMVQEDS